MSNYSELLKDPRWQRKRLEILNRDNWFCQACADNESTLHVHHIKYTSRLPWETPDNLLVTLCESCHKKEDELKDFDYYDVIADTGLTRKDLTILLRYIKFRMLHPEFKDTPFWILNRELIPRLLDQNEHDLFYQFIKNGLQKTEGQEVSNG
jgi:hypothetical protein